MKLTVGKKLCGMEAGLSPTESAYNITCWIHNSLPYSVVSFIFKLLSRL